MQYVNISPNSPFALEYTPILTPATAVTVTKSWIYYIIININ